MFASSTGVFMVPLAGVSSLDSDDTVASKICSALSREEDERVA
jgi:hypothetical protein